MGVKLTRSHFIGVHVWCKRYQCHTWPKKRPNIHYYLDELDSKERDKSVSKYTNPNNH